jgi:nicotinamidase-related amidase
MSDDSRRMNVNDNPRLLLLVDVQNGFVSNEDTQAVLPRIVELAGLWQQRDWPIVCSRFINLPQSNWRRLRNWHELEGEPDTALVPELTNVTPYVFKKSTYSAWSSELSAVCAAHKVQDIVIAGVDTNECVLATALAVFDAGLTPWLVRDACASSGGSKPHDMAVELLSALLGRQQVITVADL